MVNKERRSLFTLTVPSDREEQGVGSVLRHRLEILLLTKCPTVVSLISNNKPTFGPIEMKGFSDFPPYKLRPLASLKHRASLIIRHIEA